MIGFSHSAKSSILIDVRRLRCHERIVFRMALAEAGLIAGVNPTNILPILDRTERGRNWYPKKSNFVAMSPETEPVG